MSKNGFTLLEVLITIVLIALGTTALLSAFSRTIFISGTTSDLSTAVALAEAKMEEIKNMPFIDINIGETTESPVANFLGFDRTVTVIPPPGIPNDNLLQVDINVFYTTRGGKMSTSLTTYFVNLTN